MHTVLKFQVSRACFQGGEDGANIVTPVRASATQKLCSKNSS